MRLIRRLILGAFAVVLCTLAFALMHPRSPLPAAWNPLKPLSITDPLTPFTGYKLRGALSDPEICFAVLGQVLNLCACLTCKQRRSAIFGTGSNCVKRLACALNLLKRAAKRPSDCRSGHNMASKPAAETHLGTHVIQLLHNSSYNCRQIRSPQGSGGRMSTHATAEAIDIAGVVLASGERVPLLGNWSSGDEKQHFFHQIRDSACRWFRVTLGPEYNRLHADHFHLQHTGWGLCR